MSEREMRVSAELFLARVAWPASQGVQLVALPARLDSRGEAPAGVFEGQGLPVRQPGKPGIGSHRNPCVVLADGLLNGHSSIPDGWSLPAHRSPSRVVPAPNGGRMSPEDAYPAQTQASSQVSRRVSSQ